MANSTPSASEQLIYSQLFRSDNSLCKRCPESKSDVIEDTNSGHFVCRACGLVQEGMVIADTAEWRTFSDSRENGADPNRGGDAKTSFDGFADSNVMGTERGVLHDAISRGNKALTGKGGRNNQEVMQMISNLAERVGANTRIQDECSKLWQVVDANGDLSGRPKEAVVAACMMAALQHNNAGRTWKEMAVYTTVSAKEIKKCHMTVRDHARKTLSSDAVGSSVIRNTDGGQYLGRFCKMLNLPLTVQNAATSIAKASKELVEGTTPMTIAATSLLIACQLHEYNRRSIEDIATAASITADTVRKCFRKLHPHRNSIIPSTYATKDVIENLSL